MAAGGKEIVRMENISKQFPGVTALEGVEMKIHEGEIHALVGENGAGKSTLIKILTGVFPPSAGDVFVDGQKVVIKNPTMAHNLGISAVYQDVTAAMHLTVAENFFLGRIPRNRLGTVAWRFMRQQARSLLRELNVDVAPETILKELSIAKQEMVLIAKEYFDRRRVVIFDEPTALLATDEKAELFKLIRRMKSEGVGIVYISHRLEEIFELCDVVTVLRDGKRTAYFPVGSIKPADLISKMVGRKIDDMCSIERPAIGEEALRVDDLTIGGSFEGINLTVRHGEILGLFGLVGCGTTEIARAIFGADKVERGKIYVDSRPSNMKSPTAAIFRGLGYLPQDRKGSGLAMKMSVNHNLNLSSYPDISRFGFIRGKMEKRNARTQIDSLQIKTPSANQLVANLSGGNQQKVVLGKWLAKQCTVFIFDEPTVGVDIGAKREIYLILETLIKKGSAIIVISSYLPEIMGLADRITVIHEGRQTGTLVRDEFNEERLLSLASGLD